MTGTQGTGLTVLFKKRVQDLVSKQREIVDAQIDVQRRLLSFCREFVQTEEEADRLGGAASSFLYRQTNLNTASVQSLYRRIGEQYGALNRHRTHLPSSVEGLALLARAENKRPGSIKRLVAARKVDHDSTVFELRKLQSKRSRRLANGEKQTGFRLVLSGSDREELLKAVAELLRSTRGVCCSVADAALFHQGKAELGRWWKENPSRFMSE